MHSSLRTRVLPVLAPARVSPTSAQRSRFLPVPSPARVSPTLARPTHFARTLALAARVSPVLAVAALPLCPPNAVPRHRAVFDAHVFD